jgi:hypothetical protein
MQMRISWKGLLVGMVCAALVLSVACGKKSATEKALSIAKSMSESMTPTSAQNDYTKAYLNEEKMQKFLESMKEDVNPFDVLFKGGQGGSLMDLQDKLEQYNAFAKKYGFHDYADYMAVWGRITVGEMEIAAEEMTKSGIEMMQNSIKSAEENLKKPDLSPEMKSMYEEQLKSSQKSLQDMMKPDTSSKSLNADDLALVVKYKPQIDEITKQIRETKANKGN